MLILAARQPAADHPATMWEWCRVGRDGVHFGGASLTDQTRALAEPDALAAGPEADGAQASVLLTAQLVRAYCIGNKVTTADLPALIARVHAALDELGPPALAAPDVPAKPAVPIKSSISDTHLACLEDGLKFKSLKRHLRVSHGLGPDGYRRKWGLGDDYPMVAPAYARYRSAQALSLGLGNKASADAKGLEADVAPPETGPVEQPAKQPVTSPAAAKAEAAKAAAAKAEASPDAKATAGETKTLPPFRYPASRYAKKPD